MRKVAAINRLVGTRSTFKRRKRITMAVLRKRSPNESRDDRIGTGSRWIGGQIFLLRSVFVGGPFLPNRVTSAIHRDVFWATWKWTQFFGETILSRWDHENYLLQYPFSTRRAILRFYKTSLQDFCPTDQSVFQGAQRNFQSVKITGITQLPCFYLPEQNHTLSVSRLAEQSIAICAFQAESTSSIFTRLETFRETLWKTFQPR